MARTMDAASADGQNSTVSLGPFSSNRDPVVFFVGRLHGFPALHFFALLALASSNDGYWNYRVRGRHWAIRLIQSTVRKP